MNLYGEYQPMLKTIHLILVVQCRMPVEHIVPINIADPYEEGVVTSYILP
jgi:hypothetical protein